MNDSEPGPGGEPLDEVERRLRATLTRRAEDMAPGDGRDDLDALWPGGRLGGIGAAAAGWDPVAAPVVERLRPPRSRRGRVALVAAVAAVALPLVAGAIVLARSDPADPADPVRPELPSETVCPDADPCRPGGQDARPRERHRA